MRFGGRSAVRIAGCLLLGGAFFSCRPPEVVRNSDTVRIVTIPLPPYESEDIKATASRIAAVIREHRPDVVALQRVRRFVRPRGGPDILMTLSDQTGMAYAFGPVEDTDSVVSGNGMLTVFPIALERSVLIPGEGTAARTGALQLVLEVRDAQFEVWSGNHHDLANLPSPGEKPNDPGDASLPAVYCGSRFVRTDTGPASFSHAGPWRLVVGDTTVTRGGATISGIFIRGTSRTASVRVISASPPVIDIELQP